jgi:hypothetical protein
MAWIFAILFLAAGAVVYVMLRNAQDFSDANEVIPGVPTNAPKQWAGAHSPEARLHRRLRDSMELLRTNASLDDPSLAEVRTTLEREALAVDEHLVAVAGLPKQHRTQPLDQVTRAVDAIEATVSSVVLLRGPSIEESEARVADVRTRLRLVEEARAELAGLGPSPGSLGDLRDQLDAAPALPPEEESPGESPGT